MTFADVFAGIGGFRLAAEHLGWKCVYSCEKDKFARKTYMANFDVKEPFDEDITLVDPLCLPNFDVLMAGFPCQPFSVAGKKRGLNDPRADVIDYLFEIIEAKVPQWIVLENVKGFCKSNASDKLFRFLGGGYYHETAILNASAYGLPTNRERWYLVASLDPEHSFKWPKKKPLRFGMSDILGGHSNRDIGYTIRCGGRSSGLGNKHNWDTYIVDGKEHKLTIEEAKKMMGFPADFVFPVSQTQAWKQLGNSVAVDVIRMIIEEIINSLPPAPFNDDQRYY